MGGMWCKADKGQRSSSPKVPFNTTISRWTDHVRQAYRKPKTQHRPAKPPQKPNRSADRLTISSPQLVKDASSDGWRTATLLVPEPAPVPPPRKKRKRKQELTRTAFSMDDLDKVETLNTSTISLPDKCRSENGLDSRSSCSTIVVTPVLESRLNHLPDEVDAKLEDNKENKNLNVEEKIEEEDEDEIDDTYLADEIIPIEKETLFSSRTILQSNLGYIDKLSAISEVSAESGFEDRTDIIKSSERSESVTSSESASRDTDLNILAHIKHISSVSHINEINKDIRERTAISKKEWLQNILKDEPEPYFISRDSPKEVRRVSDILPLGTSPVDTSGRTNSLPRALFHPMDPETNTFVTDNNTNKTSASTPEPASPLDTAGSNHSVLLELLQKNAVSEEKPVTPSPIVHKEESIFLTNTKTNIIYKSLSSDKLTDDYDFKYIEKYETGLSLPSPHLGSSVESTVNSPVSCERICTAQLSSSSSNDSTGQSHLSDYSFQSPKLVENSNSHSSTTDVKNCNQVSSYDFNGITKNLSYVTSLKDLKLSDSKQSNNSNTIVMVNGMDSNSHCTLLENKMANTNSDKTSEKEAFSSSRRSSITDSLHEFEMSIYDMLKESKKNRDSSDEEDSLKVMKTEARQ